MKNNHDIVHQHVTAVFESNGNLTIL